MLKRIQWKSERGQAIAEFALVVPIFLFLLLAILQLGIVFNNYVTLTDAVRAGSRVAAVSRQEPCPSCKTKDAVQAAATSLNSSKLTVAVNSSWAPGSEVTVTGTYPYEVSILGKVVASGSLTTQIKERVE